MFQGRWEPLEEARGRCRARFRGRTYEGLQDGRIKRQLLSVFPSPSPPRLPPTPPTPPPGPLVLTPASQPGKQLVWSGRLMKAAAARPGGSSSPSQPAALRYPIPASPCFKGGRAAGWILEVARSTSSSNPLQVLSTLPLRVCLVCFTPKPATPPKHLTSSTALLGGKSHETHTKSELAQILVFLPKYSLSR